MDDAKRWDFNGVSPERATLVPAVPIGESVQRDFIICLEDGRRMKLLKRHLRVQYGLTPEQYRARWGLPHNYPMVAPGYADSPGLLVNRTPQTPTAGKAGSSGDLRRQVIPFSRFPSPPDDDETPAPTCR